jgi:zinc protease
VKRALIVGFVIAFGCSSPTGSDPSSSGTGFAWEGPLASARDLPVVDASKLHRFQLANGLQILVLEDHRFPAVDIGLTMPRGIAVETPDEAGVASFTSELMQRGAGDRDAFALADAVDSLGASLSVAVNWDSMSASVGGLARDREALFEVLADVVLRPQLTAAEAERVRASQLSGLAQAGDDPGTLVAWALFETLYPGLRLGLPRTGTAESVAALDAAAARAFHERVFTPDGALLWAVGDLSAEQFRDEAEAAFGAWSGDALAPAATPLPATGERKIVVIDWPELGQAQVALGHEGIARTHPDRLAVQLFNTVLGNAGFSARLMAEVRAEKGLTYGISSQFAQRRAGGPFVVVSFTEVARVGELLEASLHELERIRDEPPTGEELAWAKSLRTGRFALALETTSAVGASLLDLEIYDLPRDSLDTYRGRVRALEVGAIADAARRFVHPERATIVVVGPADAIVPQLEPYGAVEVRSR